MYKLFYFPRVESQNKRRKKWLDNQNKRKNKLPMEPESGKAEPLVPEVRL